MPITSLWYLVADEFTALFAVAEGRVVSVSPILRWARGKPSHEVFDWAERKGWRVIHIRDHHSTGPWPPATR